MIFIALVYLLNTDFDLTHTYACKRNSTHPRRHTQTRYFSVTLSFV